MLAIMQQSDRAIANLEKARLEIHSWGFHELHDPHKRGVKRSPDHLLQQRRAYRFGSALLTSIIGQQPVVLLMGNETLISHDAMGWLHRNQWYRDGREGTRGYYSIDEATVSDFYGSTLQLEPRTTLLLDDAAEIVVPGDVAAEPYYGNIASGIYLPVEALAAVLCSDGKLLLGWPTRYMPPAE